MIQFNNAEIQAIALHKVGNKYIDEPLVLSKNLVDTDDLTKEILSRYFLSKFNFVELYVLSHQIDLKYNEVYSIADRILFSPALRQRRIRGVGCASGNMARADSRRMGAPAPDPVS